MAVTLKPIEKRIVEVGLVSTSPLIMHKWSEKAKQMMREKHAGKKTKSRDIRDPEKEALEATYHTATGDIGIPAMAIKAAIIGAAHKDTGIEKTLVRKALFLHCEDKKNMVIPFATCDDPIIREDCVRVGQGSADLRYRPEFQNWTCKVSFQLSVNDLQAKDLLTLIERAGFGVGLCEWRPEKGGEYGRFEIDRTVEVKERKMD